MNRAGTVGLLMWISGVMLLCASCALVQAPSERADEIARSAGFVQVGVPALRAYLRKPASAAAPRLTVYIESDGAPWLAPNRPPADPTPIKPLVLQMAVSDPASMVAYLGRPCQYLDAAGLEGCDPALWTHGRFSEGAVAAVNRAVDALKLASGAREIALAGYSGGGTMAALIAARRRDTVCLVSVAAPLDTGAWTRAIGVSPLRTSLNPLDQAGALADLVQTHFVGARDDVTPPSSIRAFVGAMRRARVISRAEFDHECCWARDWPALLAQSCLAPL
jgi:dienelactone hydrolase